MIFKQRGQILGEVLIAIAVFTLVIFSASLLIFDSFTATRQGLERTKATLLAKEGLEAARSIKNNDFDDLETGDHGIATSGGKWVFTDSPDELDKYTRTILISDDDNEDGKKKVLSRVEWSINSAREEKIELATYLADYGISATGTCANFCINEGYDDGTCKKGQGLCEVYVSGGDQYCTSPDGTCCCSEAETVNSCSDYCKGLEDYSGGDCLFPSDCKSGKIKSGGGQYCEGANKCCCFE